jgi:thiol-disulfide isomerase/thioredoxin
MHQWCPVCEKPLPSLPKLGEHLKDEHKRLILCSDIAREKELREERKRQYDPEC